MQVAARTVCLVMVTDSMTVRYPVRGNSVKTINHSNHTVTHYIISRFTTCSTSLQLITSPRCSEHYPNLNRKRWNPSAVGTVTLTLSYVPVWLPSYLLPENLTSSRTGMCRQGLAPPTVSLWVGWVCVGVGTAFALDLVVDFPRHEGIASSHHWHQSIDL